MSALASWALPGRIPTAGGGRDLTPGMLFGSPQEKAAYGRILNSLNDPTRMPEIKVNKVCVKIFDLSREDHIAEYEALWARLLEKVARNEVIVEAQKDLVRREDGTSYWMKYVEYVELGDADSAEDKDEPKGKGA